MFYYFMILNKKNKNFPETNLKPQNILRECIKEYYTPP